MDEGSTLQHVDRSRVSGGRHRRPLARLATAFAGLSATALTLSACVSFGSGSADSSAATTSSATATTLESDSAEATQTTAASAEIAPPTSGVATTAATTTPPTTAAPTTTVSPCASFTEKSAHDQMLAAEQGKAPDAPECADVVANAAASVWVLRTTQRLASETGLGGIGYEVELVEFVSCNEGSMSFKATNRLDVPVIIWGTLMLYEDTPEDPESRALKTIVTRPVAAGDTVTFKTTFSSPWGTHRCSFAPRTLVAPLGGMDADAGLVPIDPADPQASDDPTVWYPALEASSDSVGAGDFPGAIAKVEDIHSPDLFVAMEDREEDDSETSPAPSSIEVCAATDVTADRDSSGQLMLVSFASTYDDGVVLNLGLYRKGTDGLWRYAGRTVGIAVLDQANPCASVPAVES